MSLIDQHVESANRFAADGAVAVGALSSPFWFGFVERGFHWYILIGGVVLITLRCLIARREWTRGK